MDVIGFLEQHQILLSFNKEASKFEKLLENVTDELEGSMLYTEDEFKIFIQENFIKIKKDLYFRKISKIYPPLICLY